MTKTVSGADILRAARAAELLPNLIVEGTRVEGDRLFLTSDLCAYSIYFRQGHYSVDGYNGVPVFSLMHTSLGRAIQGVIDLLREDRFRDACRISLHDRALELGWSGICGVQVRGDSLVIRHCAEPDYVAIASRNADRPWLWDVVSGDVASDACPTPVQMEWEDLREAARDAAI